MTRARQLSPGRSPLSSLRDGQWMDGDRPSLERPGPDAPRPYRLQCSPSAGHQVARVIAWIRGGGEGIVQDPKQPQQPFMTQPSASSGRRRPLSTWLITAWHFSIVACSASRPPRTPQSPSALLPICIVPNRRLAPPVPHAHRGTATRSQCTVSAHTPYNRSRRTPVARCGPGVLVGRRKFPLLDTVSEVRKARHVVLDR